MTSDIVVHIAHKLATVKNVSVNVSDTSPRTSSTMENEDANVVENRNATNAGTLSEASRQRTFRRNCCCCCCCFSSSSSSSKEREREKEWRQNECVSCQRLLRICSHHRTREKRNRERKEKKRTKAKKTRRQKKTQQSAPHPPRRRGRETCPSRRRFREARATLEYLFDYSFLMILMWTKKRFHKVRQPRI